MRLRAAHTLLWGLLAITLLCVLSKPLALVSISAYQTYISPHKGWHCAYAVLHGGSSCSDYAREAISRDGLLSGTLLVWNRFGDCREAATVLAAASAGDQACNECCAGCSRGCMSGPPPVAPRSTKPKPPSKLPPKPDVPSTFVAPCADAGGYRRFGWVDPNNPNRTHLGHDYNSPAETPVHAIADGIVVDVNLKMPGFGGSNPAKDGPLLWIRHRTSTGEYFYALYGHIKPSKRKGQWVSAGEIVGTIIPFYDGEDYLPHLHLGIWQSKASPPTQLLGYGPKRSFVNPLKFMETHQPGSFGR